MSVSSVVIRLEVTTTSFSDHGDGQTSTRYTNEKILDLGDLNDKEFRLRMSADLDALIGRARNAVNGAEGHGVPVVVETGP